VRVGVGVTPGGVGVLVAVAVAVRVAVAVGVRVGVAVAPGTGVDVRVVVAVGVRVGVLVALTTGVGVRVGVLVAPTTGVGVRVGVAVAVAVPPHTTPLTENVVGRPLVPVHVPLNPTLLMLPPGAIVEFHAWFERMLMLAPLCVNAAFHKPVIVWPLGKANPSVQPLNVSVPVLLMVRLTWKPPLVGVLFHWLTTL
jgi:hypothetical protein